MTPLTDFPAGDDRPALHMPFDTAAATDPEIHARELKKAEDMFAKTGSARWLATIRQLRIVNGTLWPKNMRDARKR